MHTTIQEDARMQHIWWPTGIVGGLLFISLGLELLAQQVFGRTDLSTSALGTLFGFLELFSGHDRFSGSRRKMVRGVATCSSEPGGERTRTKSERVVVCRFQPSSFD